MLKRKPIKKKPKEINKEEIAEMQSFFLHIWRKRLHRSEVSNTPLGNIPRTIFFHHILGKKKYPEACLDEYNIVLLTGDEHSTVELDAYKYEEINKRREQLLTKYKKNE